MNCELNHKTTCIADLDYTGLPLTLAFSEHVDAGQDH